MKKIFATIVVLILTFVFAISACDSNEVSKFTIDLDTNGGNEISSFVVEGEQLDFSSSIPTPSKVGHEFIGWYTDENLSTKWDGTVKANLTLYANWSVNSYTISFESNGGNAINNLTLKYYDTIPTLEIPVRMGYKFGGWYTDSDCTKSFTMVNMPANDVTLYAKWVINEYVIRFLKDNTEISRITVNYNDTIPSENIPTNITKKGFDFVGWKVDGNAFDLSTPITSDLDIHANFVIKQYKVLFTISEDEVVTVNYDFDSSIQAIANPTKEGHTFAGWTILDSETNEYKLFDFLNEKMPDHDITLYPSWTVNNYNITFVLNSGTGVENLNNIPFNSIIQMPENPKRDGYTFAGWYLDAGFNKELQDPKMPAKHLTLYAKWEAKPYTITFDSKGGSNVSAITQPYGSNVSEPNAPSKDGYTFAGWYTEENQKYSFTTMPLNGISLHAEWTAKSYTITFDSKGGSSVTAITQPYGSDVTEPNAPSKDGYTFFGWYTEENQKYSFTTMPLNGISLHAEWTPNLYKITFLGENGDVISANQVAYDSVPIKPANPTKETIDKYTYTFVGWTDVKTGTLYTEIPAVKGETTYKATFAETERLYTIKWVNESIILETDNDVKFSAEHVFNGVEPTKEKDAQYTYTFKNWSSAVVDLENSVITYYAEFDSHLRSYSITWIDGDGNTLKTETVNYGVTPSYTGEDPRKTATAEYTYTFTGWSPEVVSVTGEATYTAVFDSTINKYTVTFKNEDGTVLQSSEVEYGQTPVYGEEIPLKDNTAQYTFTFKGWDKEISAVTGEVIYTAVFDSTINKYTVTFKNEDGTVLQSSEVEYGVTPKFTEEEPTKDKTDQYTYKFAGWDKPIVSVTGDVTYTATFTSDANSYTVTWKSINNNGEEYTYVSTVVVFGKEITLPEDPRRTGYEFIGWNNIPSTMPAEDITIIAQWKVINYTITFLDEEGNEISSSDIAYGSTVTKPTDPTKLNTEKFSYTFAGWKNTSTNVVSLEIPNVSGKATYQATFKEVERTYTINWVNDSILKTSEALYSEALESANKFDGEEPTKAKTAQYSYSFKGWSKAVVDSENGTITFTAEFSETINKYEITWVDGDGNTLKTEEVSYGETPVYTGATPTKTKTAQYTYEFKGWNPKVVSVTGKATYTAQFDGIVNKYTVKFVNENGLVLQTIEVDYGQTPEYTMENPTKAGDVQYSYTFAGWDKEIESVTGDVTYTATFTQSVNKYTIKFVNEDGTELQTSKVEYGQTPVYEGAVPTKTPTNEYFYEFKNWTPEVVSVTGEATYTATFTEKANTYTVTWTSIDENGNVITYKTTEVKYKENITTPANPSRIGYKFNGWNDIPTTMPAENVTIASKWIANTYTVTFNGNGMTSGEMTYQTFEYDEFKKLSPNAFEKTGYIFKGWSTVDGENATVEYIDEANVEKLVSEDEGNIVLFAVWEKEQYAINITLGISPGYENEITLDEIKVPYEEFLGQFLSSNKITLTRVGNEITKIYDVNDENKTNISIDSYPVRKSISLKVEYKPLKYDFSIYIDGKVFYSAEQLVYGSKLSYESIIEQYREKAAILNELATVIQGYMGYVMMFGGDMSKVSILEAGIAANHPLLEEFDTKECVNFEGKTYGDIINQFATLSTNYNIFLSKNLLGIATYIQDFISVIHNEIATHIELVRNLKPYKEGQIFYGFVLDENSTYKDNTSGSPYTDFVPSGIGGVSGIIANFDYAPKLDLTVEDNYIHTNTEKSIIWDSEWEEFVNNNLVDNYGYSNETKDNFEVTFDICHYNATDKSLLVLDTVDKDTFKYQFMTKDTFSMPGLYEVVIIANIRITEVVNEVEYLLANFSTAVYTPISVSLAPQLDNATTTGEGNYFYTRKDNENNQIIYLFTNTEYNFSNYIEVESFNGSNPLDHVEVTYSGSEITAQTATTLNTTMKYGKFVIKSYSVYDKENPENNIYETVYAYVFPTITGFEFEDSLTQFQFTTKEGSPEFLSENATDLYKIGVRDEQFTSINDSGREVSITDYANNGVKLGVNLYSSGSLVKYFDVFKNFEITDDYIIYNFYKYTSSGWQKIEDAELNNFRIQKGDVFEFNAIQGASKYKLEASINTDYIPKANINLFKPIELEFELNECVNIYTHEKLQSIYANLNYNKGINIHKDITAYLTDIDRYTNDLAVNNPAIKLLAGLTKEEMDIIMTGNTKDIVLDYRLYKDNIIPYSTAKTKGNVSFDGKPINFNPWELHHLLVLAYNKYKTQINNGDCKDYFDELATFRTGNIYFRGAIVPPSYSEDYKIYGNYFEIDGSKLDFFSINSTSNLSGVAGYEVVNAQSSIFNYTIHSNIKDFNEAMSSNYEIAWYENYVQSNSTLTVNDLIITGNTSTTHTAGDDLTNTAIALMNRNSGGYNGISSYFGGNLNVNNCVVRSTVLGIAMRHEGMMNINSTYVLSCWANSIYGVDANDVTIKNSYIKDSGGSALYFEDTESNYDPDKDGISHPASTNKVYLYDNTRIENYVVGTEGYFNAYGMTAAVALLKGEMEQGLVKDFNYQSIIKRLNYVNLETEMINFTSMLVTSGGNYSQNKDAKAVCNIELIVVDSMTNEPIASHTVANYPPVSTSPNRHQIIELPEESINDAYYALSYVVPGKGHSILGLGANKIN